MHTNDDNNNNDNNNNTHILEFGKYLAVRFGPVSNLTII